jgi:hypothetical protein
MIVIVSAIRVFGEEGSAVPPGAGSQLNAQKGHPLSLAEQYLIQVVKKSRPRKMVVGGFCIAGGAGFLASGISELGKEEGLITQTGGIFGILCGSAGVAGGVFIFIYPGRAERAYKEIQTIADPAQREKACENALADLSRKGRKGRLVGGGLFAVTAASAAASMGLEGWTVIVPASLGAYALFSILVKSPAEKANRAYLERKSLGPASSWFLGLAPRGGLQVGFSMEF